MEKDPKKNLTKKATMNNILDSLLKIIKNEFKKITDFRQISKITYELSDILLDSLLLFLLQFSSFRQFKKVINYYRLKPVVIDEYILCKFYKNI